MIGGCHWHNLCLTNWTINQEKCTISTCDRVSLGAFSHVVLEPRRRRPTTSDQFRSLPIISDDFRSLPTTSDHFRRPIEIDTPPRQSSEQPNSFIFIYLSIFTLSSLNSNSKVCGGWRLNSLRWRWRHHPVKLNPGSAKRLSCVIFLKEKQTFKKLSSSVSPSKQGFKLNVITFF